MSLKFNSFMNIFYDSDVMRWSKWYVSNGK